MSLIQNTKTCGKCKEDKPLEEFRKSANGRFGVFNFCQICQDKYNKELYNKKKEARKEQIKTWNKENLDKTKKYKEKWYTNKKKGNK